MKTRIRLLHHVGVFAKTWTATVLAGAILGGLFFISYFGTYPINPTNIDWLLNNNDLEQHYTGWVFFREGSWQFPFGMIEGLAYPYGIPITYIDSIPLFALFFKLLSPILPSTFQYFGIWGLLCFILQGSLGALIIRRFSKSLTMAVIGSLLFVITPVFIGRMFIHTALAANWLILAGIVTLLYYKRLHAMGVKWEILVWTILLTLVVLIHPYYLPMVGVFFASYIVLSYASLLHTTLVAIIPSSVMLIIFWSIGGFALQGDSGAGGLDTYGFNLISPINPLGWSDILTSRPIGVESTETQNYLGLGVLILAVVAFALSMLMRYDRLLARVIVGNKRIILVIGLFLVLFILSLGTIIRYQANILFDLRDLPQRILEKWATFRSSSRLFWPIYYLITTGAIAIVLMAFSKKKNFIGALVIVGLAVGVQYIDIVRSPQGMSRPSLTDNQVEKSMAERHILWYAKSDKYSAKDNKKHMIYVDSMTPRDFFNLNEFAMTEGLTMNTGYFSRSPKAGIDNLIDETKRQIETGSDLNDESLYVLRDTTFASMQMPRDVYIIDHVAQYVFIYEK